jgi:hypothetical protein
MTVNGNELYAAARARALGRTGDPQHAGGPPARDWSRACGCGHSGRLHNIEHVKAECSVATAAGPCGCRAYSPPEEAVA